MTGSDNVQIPAEQLESIGTSLGGIKGELNDRNSLLRELEGADDIHGAMMQAAVDGFLNEWSASRKTLIDNIGKLGTVSFEIAVQTASFDSELGYALAGLAGQIEHEGIGGTM